VTDIGCIAVVDTGALRGAWADGVCRFLGVPYCRRAGGGVAVQGAAAACAWTGGRDATRPGATAPQPRPALRPIDLVPLVGLCWCRGGTTS
jgi:para-nitrobenzyl esterase